MPDFLFEQAEKGYAISMRNSLGQGAGSCSGAKVFKGFENKEGRPHDSLKDSQYAHPETGCG